MHVFLCSAYVLETLGGPKEGMRSPGAGVLGGCELHHVGAGKQSGFFAGATGTLDSQAVSPAQLAAS